jgi:hypothetical protein
VALKFGSFSITLCSLFLKDVASVLHFLSIGTSRLINNGESINFWHDNCPLTLQFPLVFAETKNDSLSIAQI